MPVGLCESSAAEGCITFEAAGEKVSCGFEFVSDETEAEEPGSHCVLGVFGLLGLGACALYCLCHVAECKAKLNVALELACVNAALSSVAGCVELEESELNRALCEGRVEVEHVVAAAVVMLASSVVCVLCSVPNVRELCHCCRLVGVDRFKELSVNRSAVAAYAGAVKVECLCKKRCIAVMHKHFFLGIFHSTDSFNLHCESNCCPSGGYYLCYLLGLLIRVHCKRKGFIYTGKVNISKKSLSCINTCALGNKLLGSEGLSGINIKNSRRKESGSSFAKIDEALEMPNLIDVQKKSYQWFLDVGLKEVLDDI